MGGPTTSLWARDELTPELIRDVDTWIASLDAARTRDERWNREPEEKRARLPYWPDWDFFPALKNFEPHEVKARAGTCSIAFTPFGCEASAGYDDCNQMDEGEKQAIADALGWMPAFNIQVDRCAINAKITARRCIWCFGWPRSFAALCGWTSALVAHFRLMNSPKCRDNAGLSNGRAAPNTTNTFDTDSPTRFFCARGWRTRAFISSNRFAFCRRPPISKARNSGGQIETHQLEESTSS